MRVAAQSLRRLLCPRALARPAPAAPPHYIDKIYRESLLHRPIEHSTKISPDNNYCTWLHSLISVVGLRARSDRWLNPIVGCTCTVCPDAEGWRTADALLSKSASPHFTIPVVWPAVPSPLRGLASIYDYVHFASRSDVFVCVCVPQVVVPVFMPYSKSCIVTLFQGS